MFFSPFKSIYVHLLAERIIRSLLTSVEKIRTAVDAAGNAALGSNFANADHGNSNAESNLGELNHFV